MNRPSEGPHEVYWLRSAQRRNIRNWDSMGPRSYRSFEGPDGDPLRDALVISILYLSPGWAVRSLRTPNHPPRPIHKRSHICARRARAWGAVAKHTQSGSHGSQVPWSGKSVELFARDRRRRSVHRACLPSSRTESCHR
jgi:hypothetical protein